MENNLAKPIVNQINVKGPNKKKRKLKVQSINNPRDKQKSLLLSKMSRVRAPVFFI